MIIILLISYLLTGSFMALSCAIPNNAFQTRPIIIWSVLTVWLWPVTVLLHAMLGIVSNRYAQ